MEDVPSFEARYARGAVESVRSEERWLCLVRGDQPTEAKKDQTHTDISLGLDTSIIDGDIGVDSDGGNVVGSGGVQQAHYARPADKSLPPQLPRAPLQQIASSPSDATISPSPPIGGLGPGCVFLDPFGKCSIYEASA